MSRRCTYPGIFLATAIVPIENSQQSLTGLLPLALAVAALLLAFLFGYVVPQIRRNRVRRSPIQIADFGLQQEVLPPRPMLRTPPRAPAVTPVAPVDAIRGHGTMSPPGLDVARTGTDGFSRNDSRQTAETPVLRLETVGPDAGARSPLRAPPSKTPRSTEGTLQFLPGRFEIVEGRDLGQEIRFVRAPGAAEVEITLGRGDGPQHKHVQLHEPTVSRLHARMTLEGRRWQIANLSQTNPAVVNGVPLDTEGASHVLSEGDRVELGEVVLRFRTR